MNRYGKYVRRAAVLAGVIAAGAVVAGPASAANTRTVSCAGNADGCVASVSLSGGTTNRTVFVRLTDTDFVRVGRRVINTSPRGTFSTRNGHFALGGSEFIFTLNSARSNPRGSRLILLFAAGRPA